MHKLLLPLIVLALSNATCLAQDATDQKPSQNWHQFRGPEASGVSRTAKPCLNWSESENVQWKVAIDGQGTSTPIVWGNQVILLTTIPTNEKDESIPDPEDQPKTNFFDIKQPNRVHEFAVLSLDRNSGKELWRQVVNSKIPHEGAHQDNDFASGTPVTDGERLYCWFGSAGLYCLDLQGNLIWQRDLGEVKIGSSLGEGCSPVLHEDKLIIVRDNKDASRISVLEAETGQTIWEKDRDEGNAWATPCIVEHAGKTQIITAASNFIRSYDLNSGDIIWQCSGLTGNVTPCPVIQEDHVICMSGYSGYAAMSIPYTETGDLSGSEKILWTKDRGTPYIPSPVLYDGLLYYIQSNQSILTCVDAKSGDVRFGPVRLNGIDNVYASLVGANGHIFILGRNGTTLVIERAETFKLSSTNRLDDRFDASPALAGSQLFLRGANHLYCLSANGSDAAR